jgi:hypothetical protein
MKMIGYVIDAVRRGVHRSRRGIDAAVAKATAIFLGIVRHCTLSFLSVLKTGRQADDAYSGMGFGLSTSGSGGLP